MPHAVLIRLQYHSCIFPFNILYTFATSCIGHSTFAPLAFTVISNVKIKRVIFPVFKTQFYHHLNLLLHQPLTHQPPPKIRMHFSLPLFTFFTAVSAIPSPHLVPATETPTNTTLPNESCSPTYSYCGSWLAQNNGTSPPYPPSLSHFSLSFHPEQTQPLRCGRKIDYIANKNKTEKDTPPPSHPTLFSFAPLIVILCF
jgi:hypothetical protein